MRPVAYMIRTVMALAALVIFAGMSNSDAAIEYTIKKGDNPSSIARKYKVSVKDLMRENRVSAKKMKPGTRITIPSNKTAVNRKVKKTDGDKEVRARA